MEQLLLVSSILLWIVVLFNLLLTLALVRRLGTARQGPKTETLKVGQPAPDFTAETLEGQTVKLADFAGRSLALVFVSPTCAPCTERLPELEALGPSARQSGTEMMLVYRTSAAETRAYMGKHDVTLPVLLAPRPNSLWQDYKVPGTPFYCLIDEARKVAATDFLSAASWEELAHQWMKTDGSG